MQSFAPTMRCVAYRRFPSRRQWSRRQGTGVLPKSFEGRARCPQRAAMRFQHAILLGIRGDRWRAGDRAPYLLDLAASVEQETRHKGANLQEGFVSLADVSLVKAEATMPGA